MGNILGVGQDIWDKVSGNEANKNNAREAQKQRDWEKEMSDTAHQREAVDLEKAGFNPLLTGTSGSGASTPSGASATSMTTPGAELSALVGALATLKNANTSAKSSKSQEEVNKKQVDNIVDEIHHRGLQSARETAKMLQEVKESNARISKLEEETIARSWTNEKNKELGITDLDTGTNRQVARLPQAGKGISARMHLAGDKAINEELRYKNQLKEEELENKVFPYLKDYEKEIWRKARRLGNVKVGVELMNRARARGYKE